MPTLYNWRKQARAEGRVMHCKAPCFSASLN